MNKTVSKLILLLIGLSAGMAKAQNPIVVVEQRGSYPVSEHLYVLEDPGRKISFQQILNGAYSSRFAPNQIESLNFGFTQSAYWFSFEVYNPLPYARELVLNIAYPYIDHLKFYEVRDDGKIDSLITGDQYPFDSRSISNRNYLIALNLKAGKTYTYYMWIYNHGQTLRVPISLQDVPTFIEEENVILGINGIIYGLFLFIILFNLFLWATIRDKIYIQYSAFVLFLTLFLLGGDGFSYQYHWPGWPWWSNHSVILFVSLTAYFVISFSQTYLATRRFVKGYHKIMDLFKYLALINAGLTLLPDPVFLWSIKIINVLSATNIIVVILAGFVVLKYNKVQATYFLISFALLTGGVLLYVLRNAGILPHNTLTVYGVKIGLVSDVILLSFAVTERFRRIKQQTTEQLEERVKERTQRIQQQKEEIQSQADLMSNINKELNQKNLDITDSINYAKQIQTAMMPSMQYVHSLFDEIFIYYQPQSIVSGDFYWFAEKGGKVVAIASDCTGHGVPGALMSMIGSSLLNDIVNQKNISRPADILYALRQSLIETLGDRQSGTNLIDGMDLAICLIDKKTHKIEYAGAFNPLYIITQKRIQTETDSDFTLSEQEKSYLYEIKADKMPVGVYAEETEPYTNHVVQANKGDMVYLFSDGYADQFGGTYNKKFKYSRLKRLLLRYNKISAKHQKEEVENVFVKWKADHQQTDDVLVMGIRL